MGVPINNVTRRVVYAASGTGPYNFTFEILAATDIAVYRDDTLLTLTTNYTVTINPNGTGYVTLTATPTGATQIAIVGNRTISRTTDFVTGGDFFANTLNDELDQQTIFAQQNAEGLQRALQAPQTDPTSINMTLPGRTARANKTLTFDANGNPAAGVSAADVANAVTYASNAAASATAAAASASAASSSASSASGSASTATTQASNASTSATNAANSASAASTSATNAASSASTAATQASNASTSATNAASSASAASTSASNAAASATNASNSASSASTSATNAANSATAAASSASSAAASAASAATALDSFDDRYLGTKASDPTLDNDGNALVSGALYFSTSQNIMKVYDGASWIAATSAGNTSLLRFRYIATAGQTTFSGADSNSATLTYTVNNIVVFLNGVALDQTEYTATSGTSVVLTTGAALNDELVIVAFKSFVTADMVPASTGGTYAGNLTYAPGTANHVLYLNGSKIISGSANMTFNGTTLTVNDLTDSSLTANRVVYAGTGGNLLTSSNLFFDGTNLGIGTASPAEKLDVVGVYVQAADTRTNNTNKLFGLRMPHYANATAAVNLIGAVSTSGGNTVYIGGNDTSFAGTAATSIQFYTAATGSVASGTQRMIIDSAGNVGVGGSTNTWTNSFKAIQYGASGAIAYQGGTNGWWIGSNWFYNAGDKYINSDFATLYSQQNGTHIWWTASSGTAGAAISFNERARITEAGALLVGVTSNAENYRTNIQFSGNASNGLIVKNTASSGGPNILGLIDSAQALNNTQDSALYQDTSGTRWTLRKNGGLANFSANNVNLSDRREKTNFAPAKNYLDVICAIPVQTFNYIDQAEDDPGLTLGVVAQDVQAVAPEMVMESNWGTEENPRMRLSIYQTDLQYALMKSIQELKAIVDAQAAEIAALKGNA